ncbi:DMT family transporter [Pelagibacterium luteolum]|uniref:EamA-like transporter family protein n=1 Tax=Pelagibacterium luteolum TaxID=440168 RepID=A0A1G7XPL9_9HYPH|nr:DMT family transporter [Pelagibacterium luteolum]SDG86061.1 EamA-like transporter family protein [Pelagibacterium luteolum]
MSQTTSAILKSSNLSAAALMVVAGLAFAGVNVALQWAGMIGGLSSTSIAFWQYFLALIFALPLIWRHGLGAMRTGRPVLHIARVVLSAGGVQLWIMALAHVPLWQAIALSMTSPFFVLAGASLFLRERVSLTRIGATIFGFIGALIIIAPWSEQFTLHALLPIAAAALWAGASLITKELTKSERPESIALYLLLLLTPVNLALYLGSGFAWPPSDGWMILLVAGVLTAAAQYALTRAYAVADASYLQPFEDLKLPLNIILGWVVFGFAPDAGFWPGAAMIVLGSLYVMGREGTSGRRTAKA